jgi:hypothetical protein
MATKKRKKPSVPVDKTAEESFAHHEAGHFVAAYIYAMHESITAVSMAADGDTAGANHGDGSLPLAEYGSLEDVKHLIVGLYAGYAAEVKFDPSRKEVARRTASHDDEEAERWIEALYPQRRERAERAQNLRFIAATLVSEHWPAVAALARELVEHRTLEGYEAAWIVAIAEGEQAKRALEEFRKARGNR